MRMMRFALVVAFACVLSAPAGAQTYGGASSGDLLGYRSSAGHYYRRSPAPRVRRQGYRVKVYNPNVYGRTRQTMSSRAAARAALKRKRQRQRRAARARRATALQNLN